MEISEISSWVREDGGGLLLLSHAGGDRGRNSNLSELSQNFGIIFENDQVLDETYNLGMENMPIITAFIPPHPITNGIGSICYRSGCSLTIVGSAFSIASSNETSEPFSTPLICVSEPGNGRVCAAGSYEMFRDRIGGGFNNDEHANLAFNILSWLLSDYRLELHSSGAIPDITPQELITPPQSPTMDSFTAETKPDIDISMKISNKSELVGLLRLFQNQINTMKTTIDKLISTATSSEISQDKKEKAVEPPPGPPPINNVEIKNTPTPGIDDFLTPKEGLTELPPRPKSLKKKDNEDLFGLPPIDDKLVVKPAPKKKKKAKKSELLAEKKVLEDKLNSVRNLIDFIEKKQKSGTIDKKSYDKRVAQLKSDLKKTQERLDEINQKL
jgi:hypothetical protein